MSKLLKQITRPVVEFDATNIEHRKAYLKFINTGKWGDLPYRFEIKGVGTLPELMRSAIFDYYILNEFS